MDEMKTILQKLRYSEKTLAILNKKKMIIMITNRMLTNTNEKVAFEVVEQFIQLGI